MTKIIAVNGFKRSGKGETGNAVESIALDRTLTVKQVGFADKLKILGARTLGFLRSDQECIDLMNECKESWLFQIYNHLDGPRKPRNPFLPWHDLTGREYLQHLGTEARKVFGADFWVDQVLPPLPDLGRDAFQSDYNEWAAEEVERFYGGVDYVVITDLRFENEARRVLDYGGEVWEVLRPGTASDGHDSEQVLPRKLVTRQISNAGSLMDLRYEVEKALAL